jgi:hypothetical protein
MRRRTLPLGAPVPAPAVAARDCTPRADEIRYDDGRLLVERSECETDPGGNVRERWWACWRPTGRRSLVLDVHHPGGSTSGSASARAVDRSASRSTRDRSSSAAVAAPARSSAATARSRARNAQASAKARVAPRPTPRRRGPGARAGS